MFYAIYFAGRPTMTATFYIIECSLCHEDKPIHRELVLTNREGLLIAQARFCRDCWNDIRRSVEDASGLIDRLHQEGQGGLSPAPCSACRGQGCYLCSHTGLAEHMAAHWPASGASH